MRPDVQHVMRKPPSGPLTREAVDMAGREIDAIGLLWGSPAREFQLWKYANLEQSYWRKTTARHARLPPENPIDHEFLAQFRLWETRERVAADIAADALAEAPAGLA